MRLFARPTSRLRPDGADAPPTPPGHEPPGQTRMTGEATKPASQAENPPTTPEQPSREIDAGLIDQLAGERQPPSILGVQLAFLQRQKEPASLPRIVARWGVMSDDARSMAWSLGGEHIRAAVERAVRFGPAHLRAGALLAVGDRPISELADAVAEILRDPTSSETDRRSAEATLDTLSRCVHLDDRGRQLVVAALARSAEAADVHRCAGVISALVRMAALQPAAWRAVRPSMSWLSEPDHPAVMMLRGILRRGGEPVVGAAAWRLIVEPTLSGACAERLRAPLPGDSVAWRMDRSFLLLNPRRAALTRSEAAGSTGASTQRTTAAQAQRVSAHERDLAVIDQLPPQSRIGAVRWVQRSGFIASTQLRDEALAQRLTDANALVRLVACTACTRTAPEPTCVRDFVFDPHPRVGRHASLALLATVRSESLPSDQRTALAITLLRSASPSERDLARAVLLRLASAPSDPLLERRMRKRSAAGASTAGAESIERLIIGEPQTDTARIVEAVRTGRVIRHASELLSFLRGVVDEPSEAALERTSRPRAAAAGAAGRLIGSALDTDLQRRVLIDLATRDPEARVRASAIESITRLARREPLAGHDELTAALREVCHRETNHRARSAAALGLLIVGHARQDHALHATGRETILQLLASQHTREIHAGLWACERAAAYSADGITEMINAVDLVLVSEARDDGAIRTRAERAHAKLTAELRRRWTERTSSMSANALTF
ncbi:MAG: hypothetical protein IBJ18_05960 [Phycisphaerales bacterium]|nr:hypothetical protein [Phycisphaerales bacterium]